MVKTISGNRIPRFGTSACRRALLNGRVPIALAVTATSLAGMVLLAGPASATPTLTVSPTTTILATPSSTTSLSGLSISGDTTDTLQATVATSLGTLGISTTTGLTLAYGNSWTGTASITFTGLESAVNTALGTASLTTSSTTGTAQIGLTAMVSQSGFNYLASNQHFYEYVTCSACSWTTADTGARALSLDGQSGYLATIPNSTVNGFISTKIANATNVWFGARSYESLATDGSQTFAVQGGVTYARVWRWAEGASESPVAGTVISECTNQTATCSFTNGGSFYSSWASGEPNNSGGSSSTAYLGEYVAVTNWGGTSGTWNDLSPTNDSSVSGYVVEFGGKTNSNPALGTGFAGVVTTTSNVLVAASASVPSAPTVTATAGNSSVALSWTPPAANGAAISSYQVSTDNGATWTTATVSSSTTIVNGNNVTTDTTTASGLTNGTTYQIKVRAINSAGNGTASTSAAITPVTTPDTPTGVSATSGNGSASVSWTAPANGGSAITGYTVTVSPGGATVSCPVSPCSVTGLTNGTGYTFTVHATNNVGNSAESGPSSSVTPATVPGSPTAVSAVGGNISASVSWTAPANGGSAITGYTVTVSPGGATVACAVSPCSVTGLTNGTGYTFTVHATNGVGSSAESGPSSSVTPATVPGSPTGVSAVRGNGSASVSWTAPANGGSAITGYTVTVSPGGATMACSSSPCTVSGLTNGTAYTFTIHATNVIGNSVESGASASVTPATVPGAPTGLSATPGNGSAIVSWTAPASTGGSAITGYTVTVSPGGATVSCSSSPCTVSGLTNGTAYTFTAHATNAVGNGSESSPSSSVTVATVPGAPTAVSATSGAGSANVSWTAPASTGGSAITGYTVTVSPGGATVSCASSPCSVTGLTNGTSYSFTVHATNVEGNSVESSPSSSVTPATTPGVPTGVSALRGNASAIVNWTAPASTGGSAITGYTVTVSPGGATASCSSNPCTITALTNGTAYTFTVHATNAVGNSAESSPSSSVTPATTPGVPTGVSAVRGNGSAIVSWTAPASTGGSAITGYTVTVSPGGATVFCTSSPCTVPGLANGTSYTFTVHATNGVGDSVESGSSSSVTPATVPDTPTGAAAVRGNGSASVSWTGSAGDGGSAITGYTVTVSPGGATVACSSSPCTVIGLTNGTTYTFTVHATNAVGNSAESSPSSSVTPATTPGVPTGVSAVRGNGSVVVSWTAPASTGGSAITSYTITVSPGGATVSCSSSPCTVSGLTNGTGYTFTVDATNDVGNGIESSPSSSVTPATTPGAPTGVSAVGGNGSVIVSWTTPASTGGSAITSYTITVSPGLATVPCSSSPCTVSGLTNGTSYAFTVHATNAIGNGVESIPSSSVTPATVPDAPTGVSGTSGNGAVIVSWTPPASDGGSAITSYTVTVSPGGAVFSCSSSPCTVTGLINGTSYAFTVHGTNSVGDSVESSPSSSVTPAGGPFAPTSFTAQAGNGSASLTFDRPANNGASITGYQVSTDGGTTWRTLTVTGTAHLSGTIIGLTNGTSYGIEVRAVSGAGDGDAAGPLATTPATVSGAPTDVSALAGDGAASVSWTAPVDNGGSPVTSYTVTVSPGGDTVSCAASPCTVSGLSAGTAYTFTVRAVSAAGSSIPSAASAAVMSHSAVPTGGSTAATPEGAGYWTISPIGALVDHGNALSYGSENTTLLDAPVVAVNSTTSGNGYWEAASDGGVFAFGDASFYGSMADHNLDQPIVGISRTPDNAGYWLVGADGGVFTFGDAGFYGSVSMVHLVGAIVGISSTPDGNGYWLVGSDGGVFTFGDAGFYGSLSPRKLSGPIVGIASTPSGQGYWLVGADGGVFTFGDAGFFGSLGATGSIPIVGIVGDNNIGYRLIGASGAAYAYGTTP